jgi:hypothetical protein
MNILTLNSMISTAGKEINTKIFTTQDFNYLTSKEEVLDYFEKCLGIDIRNFIENDEKLFNEIEKLIGRIRLSSLTIQKLDSI